METSQVQNVLPKGYILQAPNNTYRIEKALGMGGFGITYLATTSVQFGNLKTTISVAIKEHFISDSCERDAQTHNIVYSNPVKGRVESSQRDFVAEARRLQKVGVEHTNIVKVNEVFETNNTAYYVMEYLNGESLRTYVERKGKLPEDEMLTLMRPIMSAVKLLHEHHMTHLDIKPDNIMLTSDEYGDIRPVLIDFGLSKHYGKDGRPTSTINTLGYTDGYAPVEQYAGLTTFSPSADIYALGATMLFCLTGKDPKKSIDFKDADKETLLNSLSISDGTRNILHNALQTDSSKRSLTLKTDDNSIANTQAKLDINSHNATKIINSTESPQAIGRGFTNLFKTLVGLQGATWQRVLGIVTTLTILAAWAIEIIKYWQPTILEIGFRNSIPILLICIYLTIIASIALLIPLSNILRLKFITSMKTWLFVSLPLAIFFLIMNRILFLLYPFLIIYGVIGITCKHRKTVNILLYAIGLAVSLVSYIIIGQYPS